MTHYWHHRIGAGAAAALILLTIVIATPGRAAAQSAGCTAAIDGQSLLDAKTPARAVVVERNGDTTVIASAPVPVAHFRIGVVVAGISTRIAEGDVDGQEWSSNVNVGKVARLGVGVYRVTIRAVDAQDDTVCAGSFYLRLKGGPLTTATGATALGMVMVGALALTRGLWSGRAAVRTVRPRARARARVVTEPLSFVETMTPARAARLSELKALLPVAREGLVPRMGAIAMTTSDVVVKEVTTSKQVGWAEREDLEQLGAEITSFTPPNLYRIVLQADAVEKLEALVWVTEVRDYSLDQSVSFDLLDSRAALARPGARAAAHDTFDAVLHRARDLSPVAEAVDKLDAAALVAAEGRVVRFATADEAALVSIANLAEVAKVGPYRPPELLVDYARKLISGEPAAGAAPWTGAGEVIAIFDSGVDATHPDLADRVKVADAVPGARPDDVFGHGTHVAGIIAGTGASSGGRLQGIAPGADLVCVGIRSDEKTLALPPDLNVLLTRAVDHGAKVINLSWGTKIAGDYDLGSLSVDEFVYSHPDVLVVVAAGNDGAAPQGSPTFKTVGTPATAKNVLTVGACGSDRVGFEMTWGAFRQQRFALPPVADERVSGDPEMTAAISSRGPTDYDSFKPEVLAPGTHILAARAARSDPELWWADCADYDGKYAYCGGTSMAAPVVAGAAVLVRQYLREARQVANPSAALVKAILCASARRVSSDRVAGSPTDFGYPDFDQGLGRVDLRGILDPAGDALNALEFDDVANDSADALEARPRQGSGRRALCTYTVNIVAGGDKLRIVLTWTDHPANSVQNNLELDVRLPGQRLLGNGRHLYLKNAIVDDPDLDGLIFDKRNTVEQVDIDAPPPGQYRLRIVATNTPFPPQGYATCVIGPVDGPLRREN